MNSNPLAAVIMVGPEGRSQQEVLVGQAIRAAAQVLIDRLQMVGVARIIVAGPDLDWLDDVPDVIKDLDAAPFHFGTRLADLITTHNLSSFAYFGGGSAPLVDTEMLGLLFGLLSRAESGGGGVPENVALTNNLHSSDWLALSHAHDAMTIIRKANRDNSMAWMLHENTEYDVRVLSGIRPASSLDLDTPADLAILRAHPACSVRMMQVLRDALLDSVPVDRVIQAIARNGSRLAIFGRVSPLAWQALSKATQCWIRVYSEERGMTASERLRRGEVMSLMGTLYDMLGPAGFFNRLAEVVDAAIIDSRVLMAARGAVPEAEDRFASDLLKPQWVRDAWLREFTAATATAPIPVLLGGHGVVSGGLHALAEIMIQRDQMRG